MPVFVRGRTQNLAFLILAEVSYCFAAHESIQGLDRFLFGANLEDRDAKAKRREGIKVGGTDKFANAHHWVVIEVLLGLHQN